MAEQVIRITAENRASEVAEQVKRDYAAMNASLVAQFKAAAAVSREFEGSLRAIAQTTKSVEGIFRAVAQTTKSVDHIITGTSRSTRDAAKAHKELGESSQRASKTHQAAMSGLGAASRAALEVAKHIGPEFTKGLAAASAATVDFTGKVKSAGDEGGKSFDGFVSGARAASQAIEGISKKLDEIRIKAGRSLIVAGIAEGAVVGKSILGAGNQIATERSISRILGSPQAGAKTMADLREFDRESPYSFDQSANIARKALAQGIKSDDLPGYMRDVGDAVSQFGNGSVEEFNSVSRALLQMKNMGRVSMEEIGQLNDAGIPAMPILKKQLNLSDKQVADLSAGKMDIDPNIGVAALRKGFREESGGAMRDKQENTLPGSIDALGSSAQQAAIGITQHLVPALISVANAVRMVSDALQSMPEWMQKLVAYGLALSIAFKLIAGAFLLVFPAIKGLIGFFGALKFAAAVTGISIGGVVTAIAGLSPVLGGLVVAAGAVAIGITTVVGALAGLLTGGALYKIGQALGLIDRDQSFGDRMATGWGRVRDAVTGNQGHYEKTRLAEEAAASKKGATGNAEIDALVASFGKSSGKKQAELQAYVKSLSGNGGGTFSESVGGVMMTDSPSTSGGGVSASQGNIEALEDQLRMTIDPEEKKKLTLQMFYARRGQRHAKQNEAAARKAETARKKAEREAEAKRKRELRDFGFNADANAAETVGALDEQEGGLKARGEIGSLYSRRELNQQIRAIKSASKKSGDSDGGNEKISALRDLYAARERAKEADLEAQIAEIDAQRALAQGAATAADQEGAQRIATLRMARSKADRIRDVGRLKSEAEREEANDAMAEAQERLDNIKGTNGRPNKEFAAALAAGRLRGSYSGGTGSVGRMFGMGSGGAPFAPNGGGSFVNGDAAAMADGIARAKMGMAAYGSPDGVRRDVAGTGRGEQTFRSNVERIVYDAMSRTRIQFGEIVLENQGSTANAARSLRPGG